MPYLTDKQKQEMQKVIDVHNIMLYFASLKLSDFLGALNYLIFVINRKYVEINKKKYFVLAGMFGTVLLSALEFWRRLIVPYEDKKIQENGDA